VLAATPESVTVEQMVGWCCDAGGAKRFITSLPVDQAGIKDRFYVDPKAVYRLSETQQVCFPAPRCLAHAPTQPAISSSRFIAAGPSPPPT
jgi:hypothetical protein